MNGDVTFNYLDCHRRWAESYLVDLEYNTLLFKTSPSRLLGIQLTDDDERVGWLNLIEEVL